MDLETGNTILLCVSVAGTVSGIIKLTAISLGAFLTAAFIFGHLGHYFGMSTSAPSSPYHGVQRLLMYPQDSAKEAGS